MREQKIASDRLLEIFGQDMCDGCSREGVTLHSYAGSYLCQDCSDEQAEEDRLEELMNG